MYHGAALTQIVEHPSFKALNKADRKYGHYRVDGTCQSTGHVVTTYILIKHRKGTLVFTFGEDDLRTLHDDIQARRRTFACLVCRGKGGTVCLLNQERIEALMNLPSSKAQWIAVHPKPGGSMWVEGTNGKLKRAVYHAAFPRDIFK